jgi:hypothetical protein
MPRYFFHVYHDQSELDYEGEELPDKHAAWKEATVMAGQTLQSLDGKSFTLMPRGPSKARPRRIVEIGLKAKKK